MPQIPTATYRLQLHARFGFTDAARLVPYLADLGVSHVYCSPILAAAPGSQHGYDVVDHSRLSDELGGADGWRRLVDACDEHGLGIVVDIVPNHMAVPTPERLNRQLWDVLMHGDRATSAEWFDVDWAAGDGKLLMPVLGRPLAECLRAGEIVVDASGGVVRYFDHEFPLAPATEKLEGQHYRLAHWRVANEELNYRRFFDVTSLIGVRVENSAVFAATHEQLLRLVRTGDINGLRIDHPDGLSDPGRYLQRLRDEAGDVWTVVEKILEGDEALPADWPCEGTTGYDAILAITGVLTDAAGEAPLTQVYQRFTGRETSYADVVETAKRLVVDQLFVAEVDRLLRDLAPPRRDDIEAADFTDRGLRAALAELLVQFDVYRAYASGEGDGAGREEIEHAVTAASQRLPEHVDELGWLRRVLLREIGGSGADAFVTRFEQTTGPVMAKGVEDTAFYRYHRLTALNEVGGNPGAFGRPPEHWHAFCARLARDWPATMTTLSTHDTKRSEDVRARLLVLAEIPDEWEAAVTRWRDRIPGPDANTDYLLWQSLVGAFPIDEPRLSSYLEKATREAKERTSWTEPNQDFDDALRDQVRRIFADRELLDDVAAWVREHVEQPGRSNALAQKVLQLTMPGVPDVYQGQELPDFSLVDPDNRRPVDYGVRRAALERLDTADAKMLVTATALRLRRDRPEVFASSYRPLHVEGPAAAHAIAFARGDDMVTIATRLPVGLQRQGGWRDTTITLPNGKWRNVLTGRDSSSNLVHEILGDLPVALIARERP